METISTEFLFIDAVKKTITKPGLINWTPDSIYDLKSHRTNKRVTFSLDCSNVVWDNVNQCNVRVYEYVPSVLPGEPLDGWGFFIRKRE